MNRLLVIVHPGSACGSAAFNLGRDIAQVAREFLADDIAAWNGPTLVIDGGLSDELPDYPALNNAIESALLRAKANDQIAARVMGSDDDDFNQVAAAEVFIAETGINPADWHIELTGAWADEDSGCVTSVRDLFAECGFRTDIRDSALSCDPALYE